MYVSHQVVPNLKRPIPKITDFGYSKDNVVSSPKTKVGTLACECGKIANSARSL